MNIQYLKYAVEVEKTGSISQAAENLYMGQPNLSKAIRELEASLGITIFKRTSKGVTPTKQGEAFFAYAKNILSQIDEMVSFYQSNHEQKQSFQISVPRGSYITNAFARFMSELDITQGIDVDFRETNSMDAIRNILEEDYHLGIIRYQTLYETYFLDFLKQKELDHELIWEFDYLALMSRKHPLAECSKVDYSELNRTIEIVHGDLSVPYLTLPEPRKADRENLLKKQIRVFERGSQFDLLTHIPTTYMWVSPVPEETLQRYGLVQRKCVISNQRYKDVLVYPRGYQLNTMEKAFIGKLDEVREEVSSGTYE
jgi:DNA-binding transcriptional LysR family regulator